MRRARNVDGGVDGQVAVTVAVQSLLPGLNIFNLGASGRCTLFHPGSSRAPALLLGASHQLPDHCWSSPYHTLTTTMSFLQPVMPFLRPMGPPRPATVRHFLRFSTSAIRAGILFAYIFLFYQNTNARFFRCTHHISRIGPQPCCLTHSSRLIPSSLAQVDPATCKVTRLAPHLATNKDPQLPRPRHTKGSALWPNRRLSQRSCPHRIRNRPQPPLLCHQDAFQRTAHLHLEETRRQHAIDPCQED